MGGKHQPVEIDRYSEIHLSAMGSLKKAGRVVSDDLSIDRSDGCYLMKGRIYCVGDIAIDVTKTLAVREESADRVMVQTTVYAYHAQVVGLGNLFRYCAPHADHNKFHHKHTFDVLRGDVTGTLTEIDEDTRPTLAAVIVEASDWYYAHTDAVRAAREK